jgi:hypothetical protein
MDKAALLLVGTRSRSHGWLLLVARAGGLVVVAGASVLAVAHGHHHLALWKAALIAVIVIAALTLVAAAGAYATQPVPATHHASLKASATALLNGLTSGFCNYGDGYKPEQAFRSHYGKLCKKLREWDAVRTAAAEQRLLLGEHIDAAMVEQGVASDTYAVPHIRSFAMEMALRRDGDAPLPGVDWNRNWGTTAVEPGEALIPGPPEGHVAPYDGAPWWVILPPTPAETKAEWRERAKAHTDRVDGFIAAVAASSRDLSQAVIAATRRVEAFQEKRLPAARDALQRLDVREPARRRWRCKSC